MSQPMELPTTTTSLLEQALAFELSRRHAGMEPLLERLQERFGNTLQAVLFYGSCRRDGHIGDGVVDLYAVLAARRSVERSLVAALGALLPPNVYYIEVPAGGGRTLRAKVGVFTLAELEAAVGGLMPGVWGRLAQPVSLLFARDALARQRVARVVARAVDTFARCVGRRSGEPPTAAWARGLAASYRCELRVEGPDRAATIIERDCDHYLRLAAILGPQTGGHTWQWRLREWLGKPLSFLRLVKGLYTFDGALDYAAYKLSKHSGRTIEIPPRVRARPWLRVWGLFFSLYRQGVFR